MSNRWDVVERHGLSASLRERSRWLHATRAKRKFEIWQVISTSLKLDVKTVSKELGPVRTLN
jgi:hypothetical protein